MNQTTLASGRVLQLGMAPFSVGSRLFKRISGELLLVNIDVDRIDPKMDLAKMGSKEINTMKNVVCRIACSDEVEAVLFECFVRCTLNGQKITRETFEAEDAREDYLPAAWEVIRFNLAPFFRGLSLASLIGESPTPPAQK